MAEIALYLALRKIGVASGQGDHYSHKVGLFRFLSKLRRIESELRMVHCFLDQLETRYNNNQLHLSWIEDAQKLGGRVEDTVDEYVHKYFRPSGLAIVKHSRILLLDENLAPLKELEAELQHLSKMKKLWFQVNPTDAYIPSTRDRENASISSQQVPNSVDEEPNSLNNQSDRLPVLQLCFGCCCKSHIQRQQYTATAAATERDSLIERLVSQRNTARAVVAVVFGPPGSGKTALVRFEFERHRWLFDCCQWISMAGCSSAEVVLIKMRRELCLEDDTTITDEDTVQRSTSQLEESFSPGGRGYNKKFLIVFDDLLVANGISKVTGKLPKGSCLIIATRLEALATQVASDEDGAVTELDSPDGGQAHQGSSGGQHNIVNLAALEKKTKALQQDNKLQQLFDGVDPAKRAGTSSNEQLYTRRQAWSALIQPWKKNEQLCTNKGEIHPCLFLPQVTISLRASLSSWNQNTESALQEREKQLTWVWKHNLSLNDTQKCMYVAYINLPMHLKVCLLYCGIFPVGHLLQREKLVRLFVAEGFIEKQRESEEEEDIAEGYLIELTRWGFLHPVHSYELGRVASLRMPIVVHELVQSISRKEGFGVASDDVELPRRDTGVRCLYYSKYPQDIYSLVHLPHLRTLIFGGSPAADSHPDPMNPPDSIPHYLYYAFQFLRLLPMAFLDPQNLPRVPPLHKKDLYVTVLELTGYPFEELPIVIGELFNLRYLGLRKAKIKRLPVFISHLYNMQTLDLELSKITKLPQWIDQLARLRHLLAGSLPEEGVLAPSSVKDLKQLRTLETVKTSAKFVKGVNMLTQLRSLCISNVDIKYSRTLFVNTSKLQFLSRLSVSAKDGNDEVLSLDELHSDKLKYMKFSCCKLGEDALRLLSDNLPQLVSLSFHKVTGIKTLTFQENWFTELRALNLREMRDVKELRIPGPALKSSLHILHVESLENLNMEGSINDLDKIRSIRDVFFPQLKDRLLKARMHAD